MVKRAVSIGINYYGTKYELNGCINDTRIIKDMLIRYFGYDRKEIKVITDYRNSTLKPTKKVIQDVLKEFVEKTQSGDTLFVHYSGHGSHIFDKDGDEIDRQDEVICPCDNTYIKDDDLYEILVKKFPKDAKLICLFDCCHSGSILDLPVMYTHKSNIIKQNKHDISHLDCVMISGCKDDQTSADAYINRGYKGALTWAISESFIDAKDLSDLTWKEIITVIRLKLKKRKYQQIPQLSTSCEQLLNEQIEL